MPVVGRVESAKSYVRRRAGALALVAALLAAAAAPRTAEADALRLVEERTLDGRLTELTFRTPAVEGTTGVRVLLPDGYRRSRRSYPVLYLLHGCCNGNTGYRGWTEIFGIEELTAGKPLIVVMPDSGPGGGYVNWRNFGAGGPPQWETYHVDQLIPYVDRRYRTIARRSGRALAGISMGGFGALTYAARHPDMFIAAAAFSGAVDANVITPALEAVGAVDDRTLGPYETEQIRSRAVNPWDLAENLRGIDLSLRTGNGESADGRVVDAVESVVHRANVTLHERLRKLGIRHVWDDYGAGTHTVPYWRRDLRLTLPQIMRTFRRPPRRPERVTFKAAEPRYGVYGWSVHVRRPMMEFSRLVGARRRGFTLIGSGRAVVTTPPLYHPGSAHQLRVRGGGRRTLTADTRGRLRIAVELGPANRLQQFTPAERSSPSRFFRKAVSVR